MDKEELLNEINYTIWDGGQLEAYEKRIQDLQKLIVSILTRMSLSNDEILDILNEMRYGY